MTAPSGSAWVAGSAWAIGSLLAALSLVTALPGATNTASAATCSEFLGIAVLGAVGLLLARRRSENPLGWFFLVGYVGDGLTGAMRWYAGASDRPLAAQAQWFTNWLWVPIIGLVVLGPLMLFPDGRFQSRGWRSIGFLGAAAVVMMSVGFAFGAADYTDVSGQPAANPYAPADWSVLFDWLRNVGAIVLVGVVILALVGLVVRFRRGDAVTRAQLKWFFAAGVVWLAFLAYPGDHGDGGLIDVFVGVALAAFPVAVGIAVMRYHLYEIDRIISRTTSYALVTGMLLATYLAVVTTVTRVVPDSSNLGVAAATLSAAALVRPLLRRVQRMVDRRFDRARYDQLRIVESFGNHVRRTVDPGGVARQLLGTVHESLQPVSTSLWTREVS